ILAKRRLGSHAGRPATVASRTVNHSSRTGQLPRSVTFGARGHRRFGSTLPRMRIAALIALLGAVTLDALNAATPAPIACESLAQVKRTSGRVLSAESVQAGAFTPPNATSSNATATAAFKTLPAFCRVTLALTPSSDSDIRVEVWLPQSGWNHKLQA